MPAAEATGTAAITPMMRPVVLGFFLRGAVGAFGITEDACCAVVLDGAAWSFEETISCAPQFEQNFSPDSVFVPHS